MDRIAPIVNWPSEVRTLFRMDGKVVFMPGGYGGIGEAVAWTMGLAGARIVIGGRDKKRAVDLASSLTNGGIEAEGLAVDCEDVDQIRETVDRIFDRHGRIDVLFNCVGTQREQPILEVTEAAFEEVFRVNLKSAMFLGQAVAARQIEVGEGGRQVHLLSVRSLLALRGRGYSAYCATKGGLVMLVKQHAMELASHGITVNGIAPTFVYTEQIRHVMENDEFRQELLGRIPLGRIGEPIDIAGAGLFFSTPAAGFVTGQILYVDGGITASQ